MPDIVISEFMDEEVIASAFAGYDHLYDPKLAEQPRHLRTALADARAIVVRNRTRVDSELLEAAPKVRVVGRLGVGLDNIDVTACEARGVAVCPAVGANESSVAEYVITAALVLLRRVWFATVSVTEGKWQRGNLIGREIAGKALGLIGFGATARQSAVYAKALGMSVLVHDPYLTRNDPALTDVQPMELCRLLARSDVISLHVPLSDSTRHLINSETIDSMKADAVVINTARGAVVDEVALSVALREGRLGGAALDVFQEEPLDASRGALFTGLDNVLLTPHIAGVTVESNVRVSRLTAQNVLRHLS